MEGRHGESNKINWKNILIGVVIGAILICLGVLVSFLLKPKPEETKQITTPKIATTSAKKDETSDWKIFTGQIIKVSFKIPPSYTIKEQKGVIQNTYYDGLITVSDENGDSKFAIIDAGIGAPLLFMYKKEITVDGVKLTKSYWFADPNWSPGQDFVEEDLTKEPTAVTIPLKSGVISYEYSEDNEKFMDKVLSTFKFLD